MSEPTLIHLFLEITGSDESHARCVVIYLEILERDYYHSQIDGFSDHVPVQVEPEPWLPGVPSFSDLRAA